MNMCIFLMLYCSFILFLTVYFYVTVFCNLHFCKKRRKYIDPIMSVNDVYSYNNDYDFHMEISGSECNNKCNICTKADM